MPPCMGTAVTTFEGNQSHYGADDDDEDYDEEDDDGDDYDSAEGTH